jgi:hypothetical protein
MNYRSLRADEVRSTQVNSVVYRRRGFARNCPLQRGSSSAPCSDQVGGVDRAITASSPNDYRFP